MEWVPGTIVDQNTSAGWLLSPGNAIVSPDNEGCREVGKSLKIPQDRKRETRITRTIHWGGSEPVASIDLMIKPAADPLFVTSPWIS